MCKNYTQKPKTISFNRDNFIYICTFLSLFALIFSSFMFVYLYLYENQMWDSYRLYGVCKQQVRIYRWQQHMNEQGTKYKNKKKTWNKNCTESYFYILLHVYSEMYSTDQNMYKTYELTEKYFVLYAVWGLFFQAFSCFFSYSCDFYISTVSVDTLALRCELWINRKLFVNSKYKSVYAVQCTVHEKRKQNKR